MAYVVVQRYLEELANNAHDPAIGALAVGNVRDCCLQAMPAEQADVCVSLIFDASSPRSLLSVALQQVGKKSHEKLSEAVLAFLAEYASAVGSSIDKYARDIASGAFRFIRAEKGARVRKLAFDLLNAALSRRLPSDVVNVPVLVDGLHNELNVARSKMPQSVRGCILSTLGLICELYPRHMDSRAQALATLYMRTLEDQSKAQELQRQLVEGALLGLSHFLCEFAHLIPQDSRTKVLRRSFLFECLIFSLHSGDQTRYDVLRAGLELLARHAALFRPQLLEKCEAVLGLLLQAVDHQNDQVKDRGSAALEAMLEQVSHALVESRDQAEAKATFVLLVKYFSQKLEKPDSSADERSMCVRAFGQLAKAVIVFAGQEELAKFLARLLEHSDRMYAGPLDEVTRAVRYVANFISSYALIVKELDHLEGTVLRSLAHLVGRVFWVFPNMHTKHRRRVYLALARLFAVLQHRGAAVLDQLFSQVVFQALSLTVSRVPEGSVAEEALITLASPALVGSGESSAYLDYFHLWDNLLIPRGDVAAKWNSGLDLPSDALDAASQALYDHLIAAILRMLQTLNLDFRVQESGVDIGDSASAESSIRSALRSDPAAQLQPMVPKDFELFLSLVEFCRILLVSQWRPADFAIVPSSAPSAPQGGLATALVEKHERRFLKWIYVFGEQIIALSAHNPLVSGHYKLMCAVLEICEKYQFFASLGLSASQQLSWRSLAVLGGTDEEATGRESEPPLKLQQQQTGVSASELSDASNRRHGYRMFLRFVEHVVARMQQFRDELLFAAIQLVLSVPTEMVHVPLLLPALRRAFHIGLTHRPAAELGIAVLERWQRRLPKTLAPYLHRVLPALRPYLRPPEEGVAYVDMVGRQEGLSSPSSSPPPPSSASSPSRAKRRAAIDTAVAVVQPTVGRESHQVTAASRDLVMRILRFLGHVGGQADAVLGRQLQEAERGRQHQQTGEDDSAGAILLGLGGDDDENVDEADSALAWDTKDSVYFAIPFPEQKIDVALDPLLPHICYLAERSADRGIKVSACETLHAIVIFMLSRHTQQPSPATATGSEGGGSASTASPQRLYARLFPVLMRLATDEEQVTQQLFQPLIFQLIHWFTNNQDRENRETIALLDAIVNAVSHPSHSALRDFSSRCLAEFLKWSLKQLTSPSASGSGRSRHHAQRKEQQDDGAGAGAEAGAAAQSSSVSGNPVNVRSLLRRVYNLAHHPNPYKRLGASLTFSRIYRQFREEKTLVTLHLLDMIHNMLACLRLADRDDSALGTAEQARNVVWRLSRAVTDPQNGHAAVLRRRPRVGERSGDACCQDLDSFCEWLFRSLGQCERAFRRTCMLLFQEFAPHTNRAITALSSPSSSSSAGSAGPGSHDGAVAVAAWVASFVSDAALVDSPGDVPPGDIGRVVYVFEEGALLAVPSLSPASRRSAEGQEWRDDNEASGSFTALVGWMSKLDAALDCYTWSIRQKLFLQGISALLTCNCSQLGKSMRHFLRLVDEYVLRDAVPPSSSPASFTPRLAALCGDADRPDLPELSDLQQRIAGLTMRLFRFIHLVLSRSQQAKDAQAMRWLDSLLDSPLFRLLLLSLLVPRELGFGEMAEGVQAAAGALCTTLTAVAADGKQQPHQWQPKLFDLVRTTVHQRRFALSELKADTVLQDAASFSALLLGYSHLWASGLLSAAVWSARDAAALAFSVLASEAFALSQSFLSGEFRPLHQEVGKKMLRLALHMGLSDQQLMELLHRAAPASSAAKDTAPSKESTSPGELFYACFQSVIDLHLIQNFDRFAEPLLQSATSGSSMGTHASWLFRIVLNMLDDVIRATARLRQWKSTPLFSNGGGSDRRSKGPHKGAVGSALFTFSATFASEIASGSSPPPPSAAARNANEPMEGEHQDQLLDRYSTPSSAAVSESFWSASANQHPRQIYSFLCTLLLRLGAVLDRLQGAGSSFSSGQALVFRQENEPVSLLLLLLRRLLVLDPLLALHRKSQHDGGGGSEQVIAFYLNCLEGDAAFPFKKAALELLQYFLFTRPESFKLPEGIEWRPDVAKRVLGAVRRLTLRHPFPVTTVELRGQTHTRQYHQYSTLFSLLLRALVHTQSLELLEVLLPQLRERAHIKRGRIDKAMRVFVKLLSRATALRSTDTEHKSAGDDGMSLDDAAELIMYPPDCARALKRCLGLFLNRDLDDSPTDNARHWIVSEVVVPLLQLCAEHVAVSFFARHAKRLLSIVFDHADPPDTRSTEDDSQRLTLMELECAYRLLEAMFKRLDSQTLPQTGVDHKQLAKAAHNHTKRCGALEAGRSRSACQKFHGAAYLCLIACVIRTQRNEKMFSVLCFQDNPDKREFLWENVVDCSRRLRFTIETDFPEVGPLLEPLEGAGTVVAPSSSNRKRMRRNAALQKLLAAQSNRSKVAARYVSSQYLADSSLASLDGVAWLSDTGHDADDEDELLDNAALGIDELSYAEEDTEEGDGETKEAKKTEDKGKEQAKDKDKARSKEATADEIIAQHLSPEARLRALEQHLLEGDVFELDAINSNPCMASLLLLVDHINTMFGANWPEDSMPSWMEWMCRKLDARTPPPQIPNPVSGSAAPDITRGQLNVRWFIAKLVLNRWRIFGPYARFWFQPLVKLFCEDNNGGEGFHYMLRDISQVLLKWSALYAFRPEDDPIDRDAASRFVRKLMQEAADVGESGAQGDDEGGEAAAEAGAAAPSPPQKRRVDRFGHIEGGVENKSDRLRSNLELIKRLVELWHDRITADRGIIVAMLRSTVENSRAQGPGRRRVLVGLQLLGILVANDFKPYDPTLDRSFQEQELVELLIRPLVARPPRRDLYQAAAEVLGLIVDSFHPDSLLVVEQARDDQADRALKGASAGRGLEETQSSYQARHRAKYVSARASVSSSTYSDWEAHPSSSSAAAAVPEPAAPIAVAEPSVYEVELRKVLKEMVRAQDFGKYMDAVAKVGLRHPSFVDDSIMNVVFHQLPGLHGPFVVQALQLVYWYARQRPNIALEMRPSLEGRLLQQRDAPLDAQRMLLLVLERMFRGIAPDQVDRIVPQLISGFENHPDVQCRQLFYRLMIWYHDNMERTAQREPLRMSVRASLLRGLSDPAPEVRAALYEHWDHDQRVPTDVAQRLAHCLSQLFHPDAEKNWVRYCTFLLLYPTRLSSDFNRPIADRPLAECQFAAVRIDATWVSRPAMTPMFSLSQSLAGGGASLADFTLYSQAPEEQRQRQREQEQEQEEQEAEGQDQSERGRKRAHHVISSGTVLAALPSVAGGGGPIASTGGRAGPLLATQVPRFATTMSIGTSVDTGSLMSMDPDEAFLNLFTQGARRNPLIALDYRRRAEARRERAHTRARARAAPGGSLTLGGGAGEPSGLGMGSLAELEMERDIPVRFSRREADANKYLFIRLADRRKKQREAYQRRQQEAREHRVAMFRQYRAGELPDIQIPFRDLVLPLQALSAADATVATRLLVALARGSYAAIPQQYQHDPEGADKLRDDIRMCASDLVVRCQGHPSFVFALHLVLKQFQDVDAKNRAAPQQQQAAQQPGRQRRRKASNAGIGESLPAEADGESSSEDQILLGLDLSRLGAVSLEAKTFHSGILVLENTWRLTSPAELLDRAVPGVKEPSPASESEYVEKPQVQNLAGSLAELYKGLGENDVVQSLHCRFSHQKYTQNAIDALLRGNFKEAQMHLDHALDHQEEGSAWEGTPPSRREMEWWFEERLETFRWLAEWRPLHQHVMADLDAESNPKWREALFLAEHRSDLDHFICASVKLPSEWTSLREFIDGAMLDPTRRNVLESKYPCEMAAIYALTGAHARARDSVNLGFRRFLEQWISLPRIAVGPRASLLPLLQVLVETEEFLDVAEGRLPLQASLGVREMAGQPSLSAAVSRGPSLSGMRHLLRLWSLRLPSSTSTAMVWDDVLSRRRFYAQILQAEFAKHLSATEKDAGEDKEEASAIRDLRDEAAQTMVSCLHRAASILSQVEDSTVASRCLREALQLNGDIAGPLAAQNALELRLAEFRILFSSLRRFPLGRQVDQAKGYWALIQRMRKLQRDGPLPPKAHPVTTFEFNHTLGQVYQALAEMVENDPHTILACCDYNHAETLWDAVDQLYSQATSEFRSAFSAQDSAGRSLQAQAAMERAASQAFMSMASFCEQRLRLQAATDKVRVHEDLTEQKHADASAVALDMDTSDIAAGLPESLKERLSVSLVENVLDAMAFGSEEARSRLPVVLDQSEKYPRARSAFLERSRRVPTWMFLRWISQLLASLRHTSGQLEGEILMRIAREYPQALYFPFHISSEDLLEGLERERGGEGAESGRERPSKVARAAESKGAAEGPVRLVKELRQLLRNPKLEAFIVALDGMTYPVTKAVDLLKDAQLLVQSRTPLDMQKLRRMFFEFRDRFLPDPQLRGRYLRVGGKLHLLFSKMFRKSFIDAFGSDGEKIVDANFPKLLRSLNMALKKHMEKAGSKNTDITPSGTVRLNQIAEPLNYWNEDPRYPVEVPGQYSGRVRPQPERHVRIVNFGSEVLVMSSLRKPKRLTIHGSDERDYLYMVKGGEDLRLDQRVEQLFEVMNEIMREDAACWQRGLRVRTYQVVPMTPHVGMIEWIDNTVPVRRVIERQLHLMGQRKAVAEAVRDYEQWITDVAKTKGASNAAKYSAILEKVTPAEAVKRFWELEKRFPPDLLQRAVMALSISPEGFLEIRNRFTASFATLTICMYVLGIGDRHLENFLLDEATGTVVGIDFGAAFGFGLQLPVPELMPFRLTRQFRHLLMPLDTQDVLKRFMVHVLSALRQKRASLLTVMDVFVKEPLVDWQSHARTNQTAREMAQRGDVESTDLESIASAAGVSSEVVWYAQFKIDAAKRKLLGHNPASIMTTEFKQVSSLKGVYEGAFKQCLKIIKGFKNSRRAQNKWRPCENVADQVECLIDHATDPNILGRTWQGWMAFL